MEGDPKFKASQGIPYVPYHAWADLIDLKGIKVHRSADSADAWREAFAGDRPAIIDAMTDPEELPIPPHVSSEQMSAMTSSVLAEPREGIPGAIAAAREFGYEFLPGRWGDDHDRDRARLDRFFANVEHGRFERPLSGLTAAAAGVTGAEIYLEHYKASFGKPGDVEPDHRHTTPGRGRDRW